MQIDLAAHIEKLLFLHDTLVIPGFGGFTATATSASADYAGGTVNPPSKTLAFSENLTIDDGFLIEDIVSTTNVGHDEAREMVADFVNKTRQLLDQREIVTLPGVGRLYKNYMQKIQFLPDTANFNVASYGLPPVQFSPISRVKEAEKGAESTPMPSYNAPSSSSQTPAAQELPSAPTALPDHAKSGTSWGLGLAVLVLIAAVAGGVILWKNRKTDGVKINTPPNQEIATTRTETPPPSAVQTPKEAENPQTVEEALNKAAAASAENKMDAARNELHGRLCVLVVATLQQKDNADKLSQQLTDAGYQLYYLEKKGFQVGIQFKYTDPNLVKTKVKELQKLTNEKQIWIKQK